VSVIPPGWINPITSPPGEFQIGVDPRGLLPSRLDLVKMRLEFQRGLLLAGVARFTPIRVTSAGVIVDGHHAVRASAEEGRVIEVLVASELVAARSDSILNLPVR